MLTEYIDEALHRARYELIEDDETPYYGEIPELPGVWASGRTLEACRRELKEVIEGWILVSVRRSLDIPRLGSAEIRETDAGAAERRRCTVFRTDNSRHVRKNSGLPGLSGTASIFI